MNILTNMNSLARGEPTVHELVSRSAIKSADSVAVKCDGMSLTYAELETRSNQLARRLQADGIRLGDLVGICVERSVEMLVGLLGTLKAGGTYVPVDPAYPADITLAESVSRRWSSTRLCGEVVRVGGQGG